jgi:hypothetical protein
MDRENPSPDAVDLMRRVALYVDARRDLAARLALLAAGRALRAAGPVQTQAALDALLDPRRNVGPVVEALDDLAQQAQQPGGGDES